MFNKKQVLTVMSIALVSFLIGTTFNATTVGRYWPGEYYDPWLEIAIELTNLENRVNSLNASFLSSEVYLTTRMDTLNASFVELQHHSHSLERIEVWALGEEGQAVAWLPEGYTLTGGGFQASGGGNAYYSFPKTNGTHWGWDARRTPPGWIYAIAIGIRVIENP